MGSGNNTFSFVLETLKAFQTDENVVRQERAFAREGWNGRGMFIMLQRPTAESKMTLPYIYMRTAQGDLVPWHPSQSDLLAEDWYEVEIPHTAGQGQLSGSDGQGGQDVGPEGSDDLGVEPEGYTGNEESAE